MTSWEIAWEVFGVFAMLAGLLFGGALFFALMAWLSDKTFESLDNIIDRKRAKTVRKSCPPDSNSPAPRKK